MNKYVKYILLFGCLLLFGILSYSVYNNNEIISDGVIYNYIYDNIVDDNMTYFFKLITNIGDTICIVSITVISLFIFRDKKINISIIVNLVLVTILSNFLKLFFQRPRPNFNALVIENTYSFPSGHSMISIVFYGYFIYLIYKFVDNKIIKWLLITLLSIIILFIGFSRVYLGVHYVSDVVGGFVFGIAYLIIYIDIVKKIIKKI